MTNLTKNFSESEVSCKCGECDGLPTGDDYVTFIEALRKLQAIRNWFGQPMVLSSGYRCPAHNSKVSSTGRNGPHTKGAFDVLVSGADAWKLLSCAMSMPTGKPTGVGVSQTGRHESRFLHFDWVSDPVRRPWMWGY